MSRIAVVGTAWDSGVSVCGTIGLVCISCDIVVAGDVIGTAVVFGCTEVEGARVAVDSDVFGTIGEDEAALDDDCAGAADVLGTIGEEEAFDGACDVCALVAEVEGALDGAAEVLGGAEVTGALVAGEDVEVEGALDGAADVLGGREVTGALVAGEDVEVEGALDGAADVLGGGCVVGALGVVAGDEALAGVDVLVLGALVAGAVVLGAGLEVTTAALVVGADVLAEVFAWVIVLSKRELVEVSFDLRKKINWRF